MYEKELIKNTFAFVRYGWANPQLNIVQSNSLAGIVHRGILQTSKSEDELGLGITQAHFSRNYRKAEQADSSIETAYELYYQMKPHKTISLRPAVHIKSIRIKKT